ITNAEGQLLAANRGFEIAFPGDSTPPGLPVGEPAREALTAAGRAAWRDGRGEATGIAAAQGSFDAVVTRGGEKEDFLVWRLKPTVREDLAAEARRMLDGPAGAALGRAGVMAALVSGEGRLLAGNAVFRERAFGSERLHECEFSELLETDDRRLGFRREAGEELALRLVQVPLEARDDAPLLFFLLDEAPSPGPAGATEAEDIFALLEMLPLGLALAERDGRLLFMNDAFRRAAGLEEEERVLYPGDLVVDEDKSAVANAVRRYANRPAVAADVAVRLKRREGEPIALTVAGAQGLGESAVLLGLKDNSEDEKLKRQLAQQTKMQAVGQLAGGVAHDFNNILTAIIGHCDLMLLRHAPGDSDYDDIQQIKQNSNRAAGLTRQLLAFSRQQTLRPQTLQLPDVVSEVSNLLKRLLGETVELSVYHGRGLGPVRADPGQLEQVIVNLAVNARDAMQAKKEGRGTLTLRTFAVSTADVEAMEGDILPPADYTALSVADTGTGIPPEALPKIFEPFYTTKETGKGTGLGLSTVYGIVKQSDGFIFAHSEPGEGTEFVIYLPVQSVDEAAAPPERRDEARRTPRKPEAAIETWGSGHVLVVEDEDMVRTVAERALTRQGYEVTVARDGEEGLEIVERAETAFDLILSDVVMPGMDGPAMGVKVREILPDVPILFMSGYAEEQLRKSIDIEQVHFLPKPFSVQQLAEAVQSILRPATK
ncbi:MAG: ATP-binding protein, partial [Parasphingopyxis sp.]|nr:response regulator [Sphingomonadales bacterium]